MRTWIWVVLLVAALPASVNAALVQFTTAQSPFDAGVNNRGFWSPGFSNFDTNDNYFAGISISGLHPLGTPIRSFFTFDLSSLTETATSATLKVLREDSGSFNEAIETLEFFHVDTDVVTLNNNVGTSQVIFDDLGTGTSYGSFPVAGNGATTDVLMFQLNSQALADINTASGFFSLGTSLTSNDGNDVLFGGSLGAAPSILEIVTADPVPVPSAMLLMGSGLFGLVGWQWWSTKTT